MNLERMKQGYEAGARDGDARMAAWANDPRTIAARATPLQDDSPDEHLRIHARGIDASLEWARTELAYGRECAVECAKIKDDADPQAVAMVKLLVPRMNEKIEKLEELVGQLQDTRTTLLARLRTL